MSSTRMSERLRESIEEEIATGRLLPGTAARPLRAAGWGPGDDDEHDW